MFPSALAPRHFVFPWIKNIQTITMRMCAFKYLTAQTSVSYRGSIYQWDKEFLLIVIETSPLLSVFLNFPIFSSWIHQVLGHQS